MDPVVLDHNRYSTYLIIHREQRYVSQRPINRLPTRLQEVLKPFVVLIRPGEGEEVGIVDGPVKWLVCGLRYFIQRRRRQTRHCRYSLLGLRRRTPPGIVQRKKAE